MEVKKRKLKTKETEKKESESERGRGGGEGWWRPREDSVCAQIDSDEEARYQLTNQ